MPIVNFIKGHLPCKYASHWYEDVVGDGGPRMPMFECTYDGELLINDECDETLSCPAFEEAETRICKKHQEEYYDYCGKCMEGDKEYS
jgi:hypothetical protein